MKFYQYVTGRARLKGYGFVEQSEGISFNNATFRSLRDLSRMPKNTVVFEMHYIDQQHAALIMTQVDSFGSSNYCYTHALISEQTAEPGALAQLLRRSNFLNTEGFFSLEEAQARGKELERLELEVSPIAPARAVLPDFVKADVMHRFLGYLWNVCWQRRMGAAFRPAVLVLPRDMTHQEMVQFYTECVLPLLPAELRSHASVVFGADPRYFGEFPATTTCYILQEPSYEVMPMFDLERGITISNSDYTNILVYELGKGLEQEEELSRWPLTKKLRQGLPGLSGHSTADFTLACCFQHLDMLYDQSNKSMALYQKHILGRYRELRDILQKRYKSIETRQPLKSSEVRLALQDVEWMAFEYWKLISQEEDTPAELYCDLVQKALTTADTTLWAAYLETLVGSTRIQGNESEEKVLLSHWSHTDEKTRQATRKRFVTLMTSRLARSGDVRQALLLIRELDKETLKSEELRNCMREIFEHDLDELSQTEVNNILELDLWQHQDKVAMLQSFAEKKINTSPNGDSLLLLCDVLQKHHYPEVLWLLLRCANQFIMNTREAICLAEVLVSYSEHVKNNSDICQSVLELYEAQQCEAAMRLLLKDFFHFKYDRSSAPSWVKIEDNLILQKMESDVSAAQSAKELLQVGSDWYFHADRTYHRDWNEFPNSLQQVEPAIRSASRRVINEGLVTELYILSASDSKDWYTKLLSEEARSYIQENLSTLLANRKNYPAMNQLLEIANSASTPLMDDAIIQIIKLLNAASNMTEDPFKVMKELDANLQNTSYTGVISYIRYWAQEQHADSLEWEMVLCLLSHWNDSQAGWSAFFESRNLSPKMGTSPWKDSLYQMHALHFMCNCLNNANVDVSLRESLRRYLTSNPAWSNYIRHMESKREFRSFVKDEKLTVPKVREWLGLR